MPITYNNFSSTAGLTLNGNATQSGNSLRLVPAVNWQAGSAFANDAIALTANTSFQTSFQFRASGGQGTKGADGFTFTLQSRGANALGTTGFDLGYGGIAQSLAIKFDTWKNNWETSDNSVAIVRNGDVRTPLTINNNLAVDLNSGSLLTAWVDYNGSTDQLDVYLSNGTTKPGAAILSQKIDLTTVLGSSVFAGFTAATGGFANNYDIESWQLSSNPGTSPTPTPTPTPTPSSGLDINLNNFASVANLSLNGNAAQVGNALRLTPPVNGQSGSAFHTTAMNVDTNTSFQTSFQFRMAEGNGVGGADGITFVLQNNAANTIGNPSFELGYGGIGQSLAIKFDTWKNTWDATDNTIGVVRNGNIQSAIAANNAPFDMNGGGIVTAWIDYNGSTDRLDVYLSDGSSKPGSALLSTTVDLSALVGSKAFVGFTGGTGGRNNAQDILNWRFTNTATATPAPIPTPTPAPSSNLDINLGNFASLANLSVNGNAAQVGNALRLTPPVNGQSGSAFYTTAMNVDTNTSFQTSFQFRMAEGNGVGGADGITFVLQNNAANTIGNPSFELGYGGIGQSLAIKFDTWKNTWDATDNTIGVVRNGNIQSAIAANNAPFDMNGGGIVTAWIDYNGSTDRLDVYLSDGSSKPGSALLSTTVDLSALVGSKAFVGFTGGTGGRNNAQDILNWRFTNTAAPTPTPAPSGVRTITGDASNNFTADFRNAPQAVTANLPQGSADRVVRIMPLGDSITAGVSGRSIDQNRQAIPGGYRKVLWQKFQQAGLKVDFVGNLKIGDSTITDKDNNGYGGFRIEELIKRDPLPGDARSFDLNSALTSGNPDVVLLMAGTNNAAVSGSIAKTGLSASTITSSTYISNTAADMITKLGNLIDQITAYSPNLKLMVSTIPPVLPDAEETDAPNMIATAYNNLIPGLIAQKKQQGRNVEFVDMRSSTQGSQGLLISDIAPRWDDSGYHPLPAGYDKIGNFWYNALTNNIGTAGGTFKVDQSRLVNVANVIGSSYDDRLIGDTGNNIFEGGSGADMLTGNGGINTYVYRTTNDAGDTITDFSGADKFRISASGFGNGLVAGVPLSSTSSRTGMFINGTNLVDLIPTFFYSDGVLRFDSDGTGTATSVTIATLINQPQTLRADQFEIVA